MLETLRYFVLPLFLTGSPFNLRVSLASLVRVDGPGLYGGLRKGFKSNFKVDTKDVGHGDVKVRIGGPPGKYALQSYQVTLDISGSPINFLWGFWKYPG